MATSNDPKRPVPSSSSISTLRHAQSARPSSPHTPPYRSTASPFPGSTSPGSSFRNEEDAIIFELGSRWLRAGFEGDSTPICTVGCGPEECRRAGDYRGWMDMPSSTPQPVKTVDFGNAYELWKLDLRDFDLGLVEDKIERLFRETYTKYLLTDAGTSRLVLVLPSILPHPLLSSVLSVLFNRWRFPSITLLPAATMAVTAAGARSGLVVDLGWAETTVTGVYEYREVIGKRSTRAMKALIQETGKLLSNLTSTEKEQQEDEITVNFEYCEEVVSRLAWCRPSSTTQPDPNFDPDKKISIPSPSPSNQIYTSIPFTTLSNTVESTLLASNLPERDLDDEEKPIPLLIYNTLLALPPDVRGICMARLIFIGGGAKVPGLRQRIQNEVDVLIQKYGWSPVRGRVVEDQLEKMRISRPPPSPPATTETTSHPNQAEGETDSQDPIETKLRRNNKEKTHPPPVQGKLRELESLGPWAGASLATCLKVRGVVEIEREKFLQSGLAGASRDDAQSSGGNGTGTGHDRRSGLRVGGDRGSWTLGGWG